MSRNVFPSQCIVSASFEKKFLFSTFACLLNFKCPWPFSLVCLFIGWLLAFRKYKQWHKQISPYKWCSFGSAGCWLAPQNPMTLTFLRFLAVLQLHWSALSHKRICKTQCTICYLITWLSTSEQDEANPAVLWSATCTVKIKLSCLLGIAHYLCVPYWRYWVSGKWMLLS